MVKASMELNGHAEIPATPNCKFQEKMQNNQSKPVTTNSWQHFKLFSKFNVPLSPPPPPGEAPRDIQIDTSLTNNRKWWSAGPVTLVMGCFIVECQLFGLFPVSFAQLRLLKINKIDGPPLPPFL